MTTQDVVTKYHQTESIKRTALELNISETTVRKHLITAGEYSTPLIVRIRELYAVGMPVKDIASLLETKPGWICSNMPYTKGTYLTPDAAKSQNAIRIRKCRAKKQ